MPLDINKYVLKKKKPLCVRLLRIYFGTLKHCFKKLIFPNKYKTFKPQEKDKLKNPAGIDKQSEQNDSTDDLSNGCAGCGCALITLWIIFIAVSWAWGIHWFFGVLMLFFMLTIFR